MGKFLQTKVFIHSLIQLLDPNNSLTIAVSEKMANELKLSFITKEEDIPAESRNAVEHFTDVETREDDRIEKDRMDSSSHHVFSCKIARVSKKAPSCFLLVSNHSMTIWMLPLVWRICCSTDHQKKNRPSAPLLPPFVDRNHLRFPCHHS
jgi:hypothetical protein